MRKDARPFQTGGGFLQSLSLLSSSRQSHPKALLDRKDMQEVQSVTKIVKKKYGKLPVKRFHDDVQKVLAALPPEEHFHLRVDMVRAPAPAAAAADGDGDCCSELKILGRVCKPCYDALHTMLQDLHLAFRRAPRNVKSSAIARSVVPTPARHRRG